MKENAVCFCKTRSQTELTDFQTQRENEQRCWRVYVWITTYRSRQYALQRAPERTYSFSTVQLQTCHITQHKHKYLRHMLIKNKDSWKNVMFCTIAQVPCRTSADLPQKKGSARWGGWNIWSCGETHPMSSALRPVRAALTRLAWISTFKPASCRLMHMNTNASRATADCMLWNWHSWD